MRKISEDLIYRLIDGDLSALFKCMKNDKSIHLEIRNKNNIHAYYRKGVALEIPKFRVDDKYGETPDPKLAKSNPEEYFEIVKISIDNWIVAKIERAEFDAQQNIAISNSDPTKNHLIIDMEYCFEQHLINKDARQKRAKFDLLGINLLEKKVSLFEVKNGLRSIGGNSGIDDHINDFENHINGANREVFRRNLFEDVKSIVDGKIKLGLIDEFTVDPDVFLSNPEFVFIFQPNSEEQIKKFTNAVSGRYKTIIVSQNSYELAGNPI